MFSSIVIGGQTLLSMLLLYLALGLASAGVMLKTGTAARPGQLRQQINSWWLIFPVVSVSMLAYPLGPVLLIVLICSLALVELSRLLDTGKRAFLVCAGIGLALFVCCAGNALAPLTVWAPLAVAGLGGWFLLRRSKARLIVLLFGTTCCGLGFVLALLQLPITPQRQLDWLFYLLVLTALNDIGQFIFGKWLGKQKIAARISPNKTWQGLAGGVGLSLVLSLLLGQHLQLAASGMLLTLGALLSVGGFCGDMVFSAAKRFLGIKDFSRLIPGHGGILDRVDSLVLTAPLLYFAVRSTP